jgi:hypothetical protein
MSLALALLSWDRVEAAPAPAKPPRHDWPLMGDIVAARGGVPEHLILWRRAQSRPDPDPDL